MMTLPVWAKPNSSEALKATVNLTETTTLNNTTLTPGQYKVTAEGNQATFERDGKIVAQIPCTWKTLPNKSEYSFGRRKGKRNVEEQAHGSADDRGAETTGGTWE